MSMPEYPALLRPVLETLSAASLTGSEVRRAVAERLNISPELAAHRPRNSPTPVFTNRVAWALAKLREFGLIEGSDEGRYSITRGGQEALDAPDDLNLRTIAASQPQRGRDRADVWAE